MNKLLASDGPLTTEQCLKDLNGILVKYNNGIPSGVKKIEMVKQIRSMKYVQVGKKQKPLPTWSKDSEIAYQVCYLSPLLSLAFCADIKCFLMPPRCMLTYIQRCSCISNDFFTCVI